MSPPAQTMASPTGIPIAPPSTAQAPAPHAAATGRRPGTVVRKAQGKYGVRTPDGPLLCTIAGRLRGRAPIPGIGAESTDAVAVGDRVSVEDCGPGEGVIVDVHPRRNHFVRNAAGPRPMAQVLAANVDLAVPLIALAEPEPNWGLLDRLLAAAELGGIPVLIGVSKSDLPQPPDFAASLRVYADAGYDSVFFSPRTGAGVGELAGRMRGLTCALVGASAVGKSSLLNRLRPGLDLRTGSLSDATGKGRHTTTAIEMYDVDAQTRVIDMPGVREFGLPPMPAARKTRLFPELRALGAQCRFPDCRHMKEPDCAVRAAVAEGRLAARRYESYLRI